MNKLIGWLAYLLMIIGAINWGLDAMGWNLFAMKLFVEGGALAMLVMPVKYLVGAAGLYSLLMLLVGKGCDTCK